MSQPANARTSGFSLVETLFALLLFSLSFTALLHYHQMLAEGFHQQWQYRQLWHEAWQRLEGNPLASPGGQLRIRSGPDGCELITATTATVAGRSATLVQLRCPITATRQ